MFFCRKFTVVLDAPLEAELARLPFFPLERREGGFKRPPSAQTLLKSCGVSAPLAASIAGRKSEESIVEGCLKRLFGEPEFIHSELPDERLRAEDIPQAIRLLRVEIENFRAYRHLQPFDFDADLVLLYGPNGFGKTSLFDAVDFAATGDIGRLRLARDGPRFNKAATHLDALPSEPGHVTISFRAQDRATKSTAVCNNVIRLASMVQILTVRRRSSRLAAQPNRLTLSMLIISCGFSERRIFSAKSSRTHRRLSRALPAFNRSGFTHAGV